jgi:anti-anti-sigma factor
MFEAYIENYGSIIIIHMQGDFYLERVKQAKEIWDQQVSTRPEVIAIRCAELEHVDSSGIAAFFKFFDDSIKKGIKLFFYDLNPDIKKLFELAGLYKYFKILTREEFEENYLRFA